MSIKRLGSVKPFLAVLLLALPLSAQAAVAIQHWQTAQGARVIFVESRELPILDISVNFPAGSLLNILECRFELVFIFHI